MADERSQEEIDAEAEGIKRLQELREQGKTRIVGTSDDDDSSDTQQR